MIGSFRVLDVHAHIYPDPIAEKAAAGTDRFYGTKAACTGTLGDLFLSGKDTDLFVVHSVATSPKQPSSINRFISEKMREFPEKLIGFGTLFPESSETERDFRSAIDLGLRGIKLHPDIQRFCLDSPECFLVCDLCREAKIPLILHTGDTRYDYSNSNRLIPLLERYPDLIVIGSHFGGWSRWKQATSELYSYRNFYTDCSSSLMYLSAEDAAACIRTYGTERVLYGSDYPMWNPKKELERFLSLPLSEREKEQILFLSASRLLHVE